MYALTFLMSDGRVPNLSAHIARLRAETDITPTAIDDALDTLRAAGPGVFRPHIEVVGSTVSIDLRPAKIPHDEVVVDAEGIRDLRRSPTRRGADFGWQKHQLQRVRNSGADAGLLIDNSGMVISGIFSGVIYFDGGTAHVSAHPRAALSVTTQSALDILAESGVDVAEHPEGLIMTRLRTRETWMLSSLEGIRKVSGWMEYGSTIQQPSGMPRDGVPTHREVYERMWAEAESV